MENQYHQQQVVALTPDSPNAKKPYTQPRLELYGDLRDVTLAASSGLGEGAFGASTSDDCIGCFDEL